MFGEPEIERGDTIGTHCKACGERYTYTEGVDDDPPRSAGFCPECYPTYQKVRGNLVAGTWRINDDAVRQQMQTLIEESTPYVVWEAERVGDLYVYDPSG